jgi:hypothetical protein
MGPGEALQNEFNFDPKDTRQPVWQAHAARLALEGCP